MSSVVKAMTILLLVSCTIAAPVEELSQVENVEILSNDDSAPLGLPNVEIVQDDSLQRTKRQFGLGDLLGGIISVGYGGGGGYNQGYGNRYGNNGYNNYNNGYNNYNNGYNNGYNNYNNGYNNYNNGYNGHHHHHDDDYHGHGHYDDDHYDHHHHH